MNQLDNLKKFSVIVIDTGDIAAINHYNPHNATTNPSLILKATQLPYYHALIKDALNYAQKKGGDLITQINNASDKLVVNIGAKILEHIPGHISTEIDARLSFNFNKIIEKSHKLITMYQNHGVQKSRILIKIAATWEGIKAAEELKKHGIRCNLTLLFSLAQARACAESNVYLISPFVGRIYDWYLRYNLLTQYNINNDPGVQLVKTIYSYYKKYHYNTIIMAASFRTIEQILALSGCDYITISPELLQKLSSNNQPVKRYLYPPNENEIFQKPIPLSKSNFLQEHNNDKMAVDLLTEGIQQFSIDQQRLDNLLIKQLQN